MQQLRMALYQSKKVTMEDREFDMACVQFQNETENAIDYQKYLAEFKKSVSRGVLLKSTDIPGKFSKKKDIQPTFQNARSKYHFLCD